MASSAGNPNLEAACCSDLYDHPAVRLLLGDSLHPGGLRLTRALAKALELGPGKRLLDVACGPGASAIMLAQTHKCTVLGLDLRQEAIEKARHEARRYRLGRLATFVVAHGQAVPAGPASFDAVLSECSLNMFADSTRALTEVARVLRPGGRLLLSDVTFLPQSLPPALDHPLAKALCLPLGTGPKHYCRLIEEAGLVIEERTDCSAAIVDVIDNVQAGLGMLALLGRERAAAFTKEIEAALTTARQMVASHELGYWAWLAKKPLAIGATAR